MVTLTEANIDSGVITQRKEDYAVAEFILNEDTTVEFDQQIQITGEYTSYVNSGVPSTELIFDGIVDDYSFDKRKKITCVSKQDEINRIGPAGYWQGLNTAFADLVIGEHANFITTSYAEQTWTGYFNAPYNFSTQGDISHGEIDLVDGYWHATLLDVVSSVTTHNKCLRFGSDDAWETSELQHNLVGGARETGSIEWWWYCSTTVGNTNFLVRTDGISGSAFYIKCVDNYINSNIPVSANTWYRIRLDFRCSNADAYDGLNAGQARISVYNASGGHLSNSPYLMDIYVAQDSINCWRLRHVKEVGKPWVYTSYIDSYGATWQPYYNRNDNATEIKYNLPVSTNVIAADLTGGQTLQSIISEDAIIEQKTWALAPQGDVRMHDGTEDSGITYNTVDQEEYWNCKASRQSKRINKVILKGSPPLIAYAENVTRQGGGTGVIVFKQFAPNITDKDILQIMANSLLEVNKDPPLKIEVSLIDAVHGFIQAGEFITVAANTWLWNDSGDYVPAGTYIIEEIRYYIQDGIYDHIDLILQDVLQFTEDPQTDEKIDKNTQVASQTDVTVTGSSNGGGGEANTMTNVGDGEGEIYKGKEGLEFQIKTLKGGSGITITNNDDDITLAADVADFLENPPIENEANKAPTSEWAFDHKANNVTDIKHLTDTQVTALHTEVHDLATTGPHQNTLPLTDLASGSQGSVIKRGSSDWEELTKGTEGYRLRAGGVDIAWAETISNDSYDGTSWNDVTDVAPSKDAVRDIIDPLTSAVRYSGVWTPGTDMYPENQEDDTNGSTVGTSVFTSIGHDFTSEGVLVGDILNIREGVDLGFYVIDVVGTTTITCTDDTFGTVSSLEYQIFRAVGGEYWICDADGEYDTVWYEVGDWLIWNDTEIQWDRIRNSFGDNIISVAPGDDIQTAIDEIELIGAGTVILLTGTHTLSTTLSINNATVNIWIKGQGDSTIISTGDRRGIAIDSSQNCRFSDFKIDASAVTGVSTEIIDCDQTGNGRITMERIHIVGGGDYGFGIYAFSPEVSLYNCYMTDCTYGIYFFTTHDSICMGNEITSSTRGIVLSDGEHNAVVGNICSNNTNDGILVAGSDYNSITGNVLFDNGGYGILVSDGGGYNVFAGNSGDNNTNGFISDVVGTNMILGDDTAYNATSWDGNLGTATKNVIRDKLKSMEWVWVDAAGAMYVAAGLTDDTSWNDLDLTGITNGATAGSTEAIIRVYAIDNAVNGYISFRKSGNTGGSSVQRRYTQVVNQAIEMNFTLPLDVDGNVEIQVSPKPTDWTNIFIYLVAYK